ncbi:MAG: peroxide stress protein YaaA [Nanoarchaeota archaeon]|nr:peroxide stress protein YaaA [Nanoarchaeota archaeon]
MTNYIILLPPSEGKQKGGDESKVFRLVQNQKRYNYFISLRSDREYIYDKLRKAIGEVSEIELEKILELKGKNLQEAVEIMLDLLNEGTMPAIERYDGLMFKAIDYSKLNEKSKVRFDESVVFVDGFFGLLKAQDLIPEYKLKISSKFLDINISNFWKERLAGYFNALFREKIIIDLLPESHKKIVGYSENNEIYSIKFCEFKSGKLVNVGHESKKLKGEIVRFIVSKERISKNDLKEFSHSLGYKFSEEYSTEREIIYLK